MTARKKSQREREIDAAFDVLRLHVPHGVPMTQEAIAAAVGCSRQYIQQTEISALKRLRMMAEHDPEMRDVLAEILGR